MGTKTDSRWINVEGLRVHYLEVESGGSPVLLLHGGGTDSASLSYGPTLQQIAGEHRVLAPDWPGFGESESPRGKPSIQLYVDFLDHFMDSLGLSRANLLGLSMGGGISLGFALGSPGRVDRMVLVDSYGLGSEMPGGHLSYLFVRLPLLNRASWWLMRSSRWLVRKSLETILYNPRLITEDLVEEVRRSISRPETGATWRSFQRNEVTWGGLQTSFLDRLGELTVPTLILHGQEDRLVPVSWAVRAHERITGSELRVFPRCGHWLPREKPEEFARAVVSFLKTNRGPAGRLAPADISLDGPEEESGQR